MQNRPAHQAGPITPRQPPPHQHDCNNPRKRSLLKITVGLTFIISLVCLIALVPSLPNIITNQIFPQKNDTTNVTYVTSKPTLTTLKQPVPTYIATKKKKTPIAKLVFGTISDATWSSLVSSSNSASSKRFKSDSSTDDTTDTNPSDVDSGVLPDKDNTATKKCKNSCKKPEIDRPEFNVVSNNYETGIKHIIRIEKPAPVSEDSLFSDVKGYFVVFYEDVLAEKCYIFDPHSSNIDHIKLDDLWMASKNHAVVYYCFDTEKYGRCTRSRDCYNSRYLKFGYQCVIAWDLDGTKREDLVPFDELLSNLPTKHPELDMGDPKEMTTTDGLFLQDLSGMSYYYNIHLNVTIGGEYSPFEGGEKLRGLYKGHILNAMETAADERAHQGIGTGALNEMFIGTSTEILQWADDKITYVEDDVNANFIPKASEIIVRLDPRTPNHISEVNFVNKMNMQAWATNYAVDYMPISINQTPTTQVEEEGDYFYEDDGTDVTEDENGDIGETNTDPRLPPSHVLTDIMSDMAYGRKSYGKHWIDAFKKVSGVGQAGSSFDEDDREEARGRMGALVDNLKKTFLDPFKTVPFMNLNESSEAFRDVEFDAADLLDEKGYKLMHEFEYVRVYWYENDDCQISFIFLHKPWKLAFMSYPIWGEGSRKTFSPDEYEVHAKAAFTHAWQVLVTKGLIQGINSESKMEASRMIFGNTLPAFGYRMYCLRHAHLDPQVCTAISKAMLLSPEWGFKLLLREELKTGYTTRRERRAAFLPISESPRDQFLRTKIQHCLTVTGKEIDDYIDLAVDKMMTSRSKKQVKKMINNLNKDKLEDDICEKFHANHNSKRNDMKAGREAKSDKEVNRFNDAANEALEALQDAGFY